MGLPEPHSYGQGTSGDDFMRPFYWAEEVEDIVTELAALKGRRCETCRYFPHYHICKKGHVGSDDYQFSCSEWSTRKDGES